MIINMMVDKILKQHLVACLTLGDGHVRHQVPEVGVPQWWWPPAHDHLSWSQGPQHISTGYDRSEGSSIMLE